MTSRLLAVILALLVPASLLAQHPGVPPTFRITGIVVNARDGAPVLHGTVTAQLAEGRRSVQDDLATMTGEDGRFTLNVPSAGNWELRVHAHNIHSQPLDAHEGFFTGVILTPAAPTCNVVFHAVPDVIVRGTVLDEAGEPVRNAQITVLLHDPAGAQAGLPVMQQRQVTQTYDLGQFEIDGLDPGQYLVQVQARPWYADPGIPRLSASAADRALDPSLDVVYPVAWYPGVQDSSAATPLVAHPGEILEADFRLTPVPAAHLLLPAQPPASPPAGTRFESRRRDFNYPPQVSLILPDGTLQQVFNQVTTSPSGQLDVGGLQRGTYQVVFDGKTTIVNVQGGGSAIDLASATPETPVAIEVDGSTQVHPSHIVLIDSAGQRHSGGDGPYGGFRPGTRPTLRNRGNPGFGPPGAANGRTRGMGAQRPGRAPDTTNPDEVTFAVPPGRYEVTIAGQPAAFLTGLTATGAKATGRFVTVTEVPAHLTVHAATGYAKVSGFASMDDHPLSGAMVLLIPAALGSPSNLAIIQRDQTNTDGSFLLDNVIPGQYILLAIDHGWGIRWSDPETLRPYLMHGTPLDLRPSAAPVVKLNALSR